MNMAMEGPQVVETDFTFWDTASDSLKLLTKLGIDHFYVLGTSQGGFIALRMALLEPQTHSRIDTTWNFALCRDTTQ